MVGTRNEAALFGPYRLVDLLSSSATATVYRAIDTRHDGRSVALKIFAPHLSHDPGFRLRFRHDAGLLSAVRDPHVVSVHTYGEHDGALYLDMRLVSGRRLSDVRRAGRLDPARASSIAAQLAAAIDAVRAGGLGMRAVDEGDVLITGAPGAEFVQLVGLGLGRIPAGGESPVPALLAGSAARRPRRGWWITAAAVLSLASLVTATVVVTSSRGPVLPPGALAVMAGGEGATVVATTGAGTPTLLVGVLADRRIRGWDLATGRAVGPTLDAAAETVAAAVVDGQPVVVERDTDQSVRVRRLSDGRLLGDIDVPTTERSAIVTRRLGIATGELDGRAVAVLAEPADPATVDDDYRLGYRVRSLPDGAPVGPLVAVPGATLDTSPAVAVVDGGPAVVTAADQREVRAFALATGAPLGRTARLPTDVTVLRTAERDGTPVAIVGCADNTVRTIDVRTGTQVGPVLVGHTRPVHNVLVAGSGAAAVIVSAAADGDRSELRFWDLATGAPLGPVLVDHPVGAGLQAAAQVGGRAVLVASDFSGDGPSSTVVWDLSALMGEATS